MGALVVAIFAIVTLAPSRAAHAGDAFELKILAATPDGAHQALVQFENGFVKACGLAKGDPKTSGFEVSIVVAAGCTDPEGLFRALPQWTWPAGTAAVAALRPFDEKAPGQVVRFGMDEDTRVSRIEIRRGSGWAVARVIEGDVPVLDGVIQRPGGYLLRVGYSEQLNDWQDLWTVTDAELAGAPARREAARQDARDATARMRGHRAGGTGVFVPAPAGTSKEKWEKRRRHGIATFVHKWEITAAYGPLDAADLRDALWLLAWFDSPPRRYEALRWFGGLRERDAAGASALLAEMEKDPDARGLAKFLKETRDHLRGLPQVWEATDESLRALSNEQLQWLHRRAWAEQGYRFSDPAVASYFALVPGYEPMPERRWRKRTADPAFAKDPDAPLVGAGAPQTLPKTGLAAILGAERARGVAKPPL